jgi:hypothetical protein
VIAGATPRRQEPISNLSVPAASLRLGSTHLAPNTEHRQTSVLQGLREKAKGNKKSTQPKDKDADGSFRVPGYRGVWVNAAGKNFVKISNESLMNDDGDEIVYFDTVEEAAHKHDKVLHERGN